MRVLVIGQPGHRIRRPPEAGKDGQYISTSAASPASERFPPIRTENDVESHQSRADNNRSWNLARSHLIITHSTPSAINVRITHRQVSARSDCNRDCRYAQPGPSIRSERLRGVLQENPSSRAIGLSRKP